MKVHEYQAKDILRKFNVPVPAGAVAASVEEAAEAASRIGGDKWVVKAQVHAGGRGKAGGIKLASSEQEVRSHAGNILGMLLKTHQAPEGKEVRKVLIEQACDIDRELYLGMVIDRSTNRVAVMGSSEGGMEIEKVAAETPEKIYKEFVDPAVGLMSYQARRMAFKLGLREKKTFKSALKMITNLYRAFLANDCSLAEINPLVVTKQGDMLALDAKLNFDDNSLFRHADIVELRDVTEENPKEVVARENGLSYISLDGNIGCLVNGAGLAMATMDIIKLHGAEPANFLDVGGSASTDQVTEAFKILTQDPNVKAVLVNIFGGIMKCDVIAEGILTALKEVDLKVPLIVRLEGTNMKEGKAILERSNIKIITASDFNDAAVKAISNIKN